MYRKKACDKIPDKPKPKKLDQTPVNADMFAKKTESYRDSSYIDRYRNTNKKTLFGIKTTYPTMNDPKK